MKKTFILLFFIILIFSTKVEAKIQKSNIQKRIEIDILSRSLYYIEDDVVVKRYPVAVGKANSQTPIGEFKILNKIVNPYYAKHKIAGGSPKNPLGSRWMAFKPSYGVHGNNNPKSIGTFVSAGCVRMYDKDVKELYEKVDVGIPVTVKYEPIKVEKDINNENPIIIVYPDYYSRAPGLDKMIHEKLIELNLTENIDSNKMSKLKKLINKEVVIFSNKWAYLLNGNYITNDVVSIDNNLYVNIDKVCDFFNIDLYSTEAVDVVTIFNNNMKIIENNGNRYVPINILENHLGGTHKVNQDQQTINYDFNYILFNNKLVKGEAIDIEGNTSVSVESITNMFADEFNASEDEASITINNKAVIYETVNGMQYISLNELLKQTDFIANLHTKDKYIEILGDINITYDGITYKGKYDDGEVLMPKEILFKILHEHIVRRIYFCNCPSQVQNLLKESLQYYNINCLTRCVKIIKDYYSTNIHIKQKYCILI